LHENQDKLNHEKLKHNPNYDKKNLRKKTTHTNMKVGEGEGEKTWENKTRTTYMVGYHGHNDHEALVLDDERIGLG
jgi:hypothetical protein